MAEKPIKTPLPADLPENWEVGQVVSPAGETVGLTRQHGYNYQAKQINDAQKAINQVNDAFGTVAGATTRLTALCRASGWGGSPGDWVQSVAAPGLRDSDRPDVYPAAELSEQQRAAYHTLAGYADAAEGALTLYCKGQTAPAVDFSFQIVVLR